MLAFRVQLNDSEPIIGGAKDLGVLTATVTAVGKLGPDARRRRNSEARDVSLKFGGLTSRGSGIEDEHLTWISVDDLNVGDRVVLEVIETETTDPVESGAPAEKRESDARAYYEHCKRTYFEMREQYDEPSGA